MAVKVCTESQLETGSVLKAVVDGIPIALVKDSEGNCYAIGDTCSHADISLSEGFVEGTAVECWAHGAKFDLNTGHPLALPATEDIPVYKLTIVDGDVYVDVPALVDTHS